MKKIFLLTLVLCMISCSSNVDLPVETSQSDLVFPDLANTWDEGMPLGNATVGVLVWQRDSALRFSLDRTDLWDLRPSENFTGENLYAWVKDNIRKKNDEPVHERFDYPYNANPAPSKIPGAAIEFSLSQLGEPSSVRLYLKNAICETTWKSGTTLKTFVHATEPVGWFVFENLKEDIYPTLFTPKYNIISDVDDDSHSGLDLKSLGYEQGKVEEGENTIKYHQRGWGDFYYDVFVKWQRKGKTLTGVWSITSSLSLDKAADKVDAAMQRGVTADYKTHLDYWKNYWKQSSVSLPDSVLQRQYDNEMYKFGSTSRENSYPISLQAVWTADNGKLPPWKGDFHHDLNTQLSYWPSYTGNHLSEEMAYLNTLWNQRDVYKKYTRQYFNVDGLAIPGVCTLAGEPMGGWAQYSLSPTVSAWLSQHFYLHWKYSADKDFLINRAYPFMKDVATFLEEITELGSDGIRTLEFSTSPEIFDNSLKAWFKTITNYDLSLISFVFKASSEMADSLGLVDESAHWKSLRAQLPPFDLAEDSSLTFAKNVPYEESHRHFSHAMAIHPLGLIDWSDGEEAQKIIRATLKRLDEKGPDWWCGYSYSWLGNMKARAFDANGAEKALKTFAECFCLRNTFHANGDQTKSGKSNFTYRPFTLEGNFAFAAGIQEMLLQSHTGVIRVFPAVPENWKDVSFNNLRAMGAFLVSAEKKDGKIVSIRIYSERGGKLKVQIASESAVKEFDTKPGDIIEVN